MNFYDMIKSITGDNFIIVDSEVLETIDPNAYDRLIEAAIESVGEDEVDSIDLYNVVITDNEASSAEDDVRESAGRAPVVFSEVLNKFVVGVCFSGSWWNYNVD